MLKRIRTESLTSKQTRAEIAAMNLPKTHARSGGRAPKRPTSPSAGYQQMFNEAQRLNNRFKQTWHEVFDEVEEAPPDELDPELLDKIDNAITEMDNLEQHIIESRAKMERNRKRAQQVIDKRISDNKPATKKKTTKKKVTKAKS